MTAPAEGWSSDVLRKVRSLASARVLTQAIGIAWFVFAARILDAGELGVLTSQRRGGARWFRGTDRGAGGPSREVTQLGTGRSVA